MRFNIQLIAVLLWSSSVVACHQDLTIPSSPRTDAAIDAATDRPHDAGPDVRKDAGMATDGPAPGYPGGACVTHPGGGDTGGYYMMCYPSAATCLPDPDAGTDTCVTCGAAGQPCCDSIAAGRSNWCGTGLACNRPSTLPPTTTTHGVCTDSCGAEGSACCAGGFCQNAATPLSCTASDETGTCHPCGGEGHACCYDNNARPECAAGLACSSAPAGTNLKPFCTSTCGAKGGACCPGGGCLNGQQLTCDPSGTCVTCGGEGQPCCYQGGQQSCQAGLDCKVPPGATALVCSSTSCGHPGEPCCGLGDCLDGACTTNDGTGFCTTCGVHGPGLYPLPCCPIGTVLPSSAGVTFCGPDAGTDGG